MLSPNIEGRWDGEQAGCTVVRSVEGRPGEIQDDGIEEKQNMKK